MVELMATMGAAAKELFDYNREMYEFDQGQRLDRELLRMEMQIKRFQLFREDVRDLVELTVGKMEMYHVVGALVLECTVIYYTEGRIRTSSPPFLLGLYWLSAAGTFIYVLLCVWFSMYASISSHSFGVRLLTRFIRLPIPGSQQINALNARLTDFERQGKKIMRIPFTRDVPQWQQRRDLKDQPDPGLGVGEGDENFMTAVVQPGGMKQQDLLEEGVQAYQDDEIGLQQAAQNLPGKHIRLFRELQAKWQCYDAYARVSMSLGVNHICMTMSYYVIGLTVLEYRSPSIMFALVLVFQATNLALAWLDVAGLRRKTISSLEVLGSVPPFIACISMVNAPYCDGGRGQFDPEHEFVLGCTAFFVTALWLEGLLHLAWPSADLVMLPKRFRSVLFLDVFGVADDIKQQAHHPQPDQDDEPIHEISREQAEEADTAVSDAESAVRRWAELPKGSNEAKDIKGPLEDLRSKVLTWRKVLNGEAARRAIRRGDTADLDALRPDTRTWGELTEEEQEEDPFRGSLLGPFHQDNEGVYYYDVERRSFAWQPRDGQGVLTIQQVRSLVETAEARVRELFPGRNDFRMPQLEHMSDGSDQTDVGENECMEELRSCCRCWCRRRGEMERERRLPWRVLLSVTRVKQVSWFGLGVSFLLQNTGVLPKYDMLVMKLKEEEAEEKSEERRLREAAWDFEPFNMSGWPSDLAQHAESLSCHHDEEGARIFLSTDHGSSIWSVSAFANQLQRFEALRAEGRGVEQLTVASATICPPKEVRTSCFLARAVGSRLSLRLLPAGSEPAEELASFQMLDMGPLSKLTAAVLRCGGLAAGLATTEDRWCLLLAGWDGRRLPVAAVPFDDSRAASPIVPLFDVFANWIDTPEVEGTCAAPGSAPAVESLSMEATGRLWVLSTSGRLAAFDLQEGQLMDMWLPRWPAQPRHVCAAGAGGAQLLFLGQEKFRLGMWRASLAGQLQA